MSSTEPLIVNKKIGIFFPKESQGHLVQTLHLIIFLKDHIGTSYDSGLYTSDTLLLVT